MRAIIVTHYDLDGVGAGMLAKDYLGNKLGYDAHIVPANYDRLPEAVTNVPMAHPENIFLFVSDLRIETCDLKHILENHPNVERLVYIDHHEREGGIEELQDLKKFFPNRFYFSWDKTKSATQLTYDEFAYWESRNNIIGVNRLEEYERRYSHFANIVNAYDMWATEDALFPQAYRLNDVFWDIGFKQFVEDTIDGYVWTEKFEESANKVAEKRDEYFSKSHDYITEVELNKGKKICIALFPASEYVNDYTLRFNSDIYIVLKSVKKSGTTWSVRSRNKGCFNMHMLASEAATSLGGKGGGHPEASGMNIPEGVTLENVVDAFMNSLEKHYGL